MDRRGAPQLLGERLELGLAATGQDEVGARGRELGGDEATGVAGGSI
jgi:hypothetical protein